MTTLPTSQALFSMFDIHTSLALPEPLIHQNAFKKSLHFSTYDVQSSMRHDEPDTLDLEYTRTMMAFLLFKPNPPRIGMIGLGGGSLAKFCLRYVTGAQMEVAEINAQVIALRAEFQIPPDSERFSVVHADGAKLMGRRPDAYDVLMVDGYNAHGLDPRLCTQAFYDDCHAALRDDGILVVNLPFSAARYEAYLSKLRRTFLGSIVVVDDGEMGNCIVFACRGDTLSTYPVGVVRPPKSIDPVALSQLRAGFALTMSALRDQRC